MNSYQTSLEPQKGSVLPPTDRADFAPLYGAGRLAPWIHQKHWLNCEQFLLAQTVTHPGPTFTLSSDLCFLDKWTLNESLRFIAILNFCVLLLTNFVIVCFFLINIIFGQTPRLSFLCNLPLRWKFQQHVEISSRIFWTLTNSLVIHFNDVKSNGFWLQGFGEQN